MPVEPWPSATFNGKEYWQVQSLTLLDKDPDGQTYFMVGTPAGGIGSVGPLVKGDPGKHSEIYLPVVTTMLEYGDPTPDSDVFVEITPGSDTVSQVVQLYSVRHKGQPGDDATTSLDLDSIGGTQAAKKMLVVNAANNGIDYATQKVGVRYNATSISALSSSAAGTLGTIALGPFDFDVRIECHGSAVVVGSAGDVAVDLLARMGSTSGNVIARGMGVAAATPAAAHRLGPDVTPADITAGGANYDKLATGDTTTIYFRAERLAGSGTFSVADTRATFWLMVNPIP